MRQHLTLEQATARDQRLARAMEQLAEMHGQIGPVHQGQMSVAADVPAGFYAWCDARRKAWRVTNKVEYARPGDPDDLARAIGRAHSNWKKSNEQ